jgi:hypothetical protein
MKKTYIIISGIIGLAVIAAFIYLNKPHQSVTEKAKSFALPTQEELVKDEETGLLAVKDVIMITFRGGTVQSSIDDVVKGINGKIIGYDKAYNLYQVKIQGADLKDIQSMRVELMTKYPQVEMATIQTVSAAKNPGWKGRTNDDAAPLPSMQSLD